MTEYISFQINCRIKVTGKQTVKSMRQIESDAKKQIIKALRYENAWIYAEKEDHEARYRFLGIHNG